MLTSRGLPSDSTNVLKAEPGKLYIKRREPGILFISLPIVSSDFDVFFFYFCVDSASLATSIKKCYVIMT